MLDESIKKKIRKSLKEINDLGLRSIFTISTTVKLENSSYLTPVRLIEDLYIFGIVIFDDEVVKDLADLVDRKVDYILADAEKKLPISISSCIEKKLNTGNISKKAHRHFKSSKVFEYKPNDITVDAIWHEISVRLGYLSGKKLVVFGCGNLGSKLAQKFVESGCNVSVCSRNEEKSWEFAKIVDRFKPRGTISNLTPQSDTLKASIDADVLIGCSSGFQTITEREIIASKPNSLIVDVGKNNISECAYIFIENSDHILIRGDISSFLPGIVNSILKTESRINRDYGRISIGQYYLSGGGYLAKKGDIVVNSVFNPTRFYGIADGKGGFKTKEIKKEILNAIKNN